MLIAVAKRGAVRPNPTTQHCVQYATVQFYAAGPSDPYRAWRNFRVAIARRQAAHEIPAMAALSSALQPHRLHRINENVSGDVAPLLAFLRELQRRHAVAVVLVHHARKGASAIRAGQALRGSSEFHAWGDSNLYLRRDSDDRIVLTVEHRAAAAMPGVTLELAQRDNALALEPVQADPQPDRNVESTSVDDRITTALTECVNPRPFSELRASCRVRTTTLYERLAAMTAAGIVVKSPDGYCLAAR
jgi:hypothetical protein